jgi:hypothetical protein
VPDGLVGSSNEVDVTLNGIQVKALLDTGSSVSTVSQAFYEENLSNIPLTSLDNILEIETAGGQSLPYLGYIEADLEAAATPSSQVQKCLMLVVPDARYHNKVPLLLGTNILSRLMTECQGQYGARMLQQAPLHTPWYLSFRCIWHRDKALARNNNRLGLVRSAEMERIKVPPNSSIAISGYVDDEINYPVTSALLQPTRSSHIPEDIDVEPSVVLYRHKQTGPVTVRISNITTRTVLIPPRAVLCELQPVTVEESLSDTLRTDVPETVPLLDQVTIDGADLSREQRERLEALIIQYSDIFSHGDDDIGHSNATTHRIDLDNDRPFKQRHRRIPPSMYDEVRQHLQQLLASGAIRKSFSPWASNVVLVRKKDGSLRMCVDYRQLNARTIKDSYALPRIDEILDSLSGAKYFSVVDMKSGYHQVDVEEEHKTRTAFTVGSLGFYEYNRMPFGLVNAPATYQRLMEECLGDYNLKICLIYLDDLIIFGSTYEEQMERLELVLQRLRECGFKLSPKKCAFLQRKVKFVGHIVSEEGVEADPGKIDKVANWPTPTSPEEVRQFLGFAGYYRRYVKNFSRIAKPLSEIMPVPKKTKKGKKNRGR